MIEIKKGQEPKAWTNRKCTPGVDYNATPELKSALLEEQGYLCAYCMRRISYENMKVEHIKPRSVYPDLELDYKKLVACCNGVENGKIKHCDTNKGNTEISIDVFSNADMQTISYSSRDGKIKSSNHAYNNDINNTLNLNCSVLKENRIEVLDGVVCSLKRRSWRWTDLKTKYNEYLNRDKDGKYKPYCGIVLWYLGKRLSRSW